MGKPMSGNREAAKIATIYKIKRAEERASQSWEIMCDFYLRNGRRPTQSEFEIEFFRVTGSAHAPDPKTVASHRKRAIRSRETVLKRVQEVINLWETRGFMVQRVSLSRALDVNKVILEKDGVSVVLEAPLFDALQVTYAYDRR
jgi:hypothetical protein